MAPQRALSQLTAAENLCSMARTFKSGDPGMAAQMKREFKTLSKNDITRACIYLMEVVGSRDAQFKKLQEDNKDLNEILKLHDINFEEEVAKLEEEDKKAAQENSGGVGASSPAGVSEGAENVAT